MPFGLLDDGFYAHRKRGITATSLQVDGLLARAISWSSRYQSNGWVPQDWLHAQVPSRIRRRVISDALQRRVLDVFPTSSTTRHVLQRNGQLVEIVVGPHDQPGYLIHGYLEIHDSAEELAERRKRGREKKQRARAQDRAAGALGIDVPRDVPGDKGPVSPGTSRSRLDPSHSIPSLGGSRS